MRSLHRRMTAPAMNPSVPITLRAVDPARDLPRMVELFNTTQPEPVTLQMAQQRERHRPEGQIQRRLVAVNEGGITVGMGEGGRPPWRFGMELVVDPAVRQRGVGTALYAALLVFVQEQGATRIDATVRDHFPEGLTFAERRGFVVDRHIFESILDLATFDEGPFAGAVAAAEAQGVRFFTLADLGDTEEA